MSSINIAIKFCFAQTSENSVESWLFSDYNVAPAKIQEAALEIIHVDAIPVELKELHAATSSEAPKTEAWSSSTQAASSEALHVETSTEALKLESSTAALKAVE